MPINSGAGGADESTVTLASSAGGGTAWNTVTIGTAATLVHDTDDTNTTNTWYRFATGASSVQSNVLWSSATITPALTRYYGGVWYRQTGTPGATTITLMRGRATGTQSMRVTVTSGALQIRNTANTVVATGVVTLSANVRYFVRWDVTVATTTTGAATVELYDETGALLETVVANGQNYGTVAVNEITYGIVTNTVNHPAFQLRAFISSATEWPPPPGQVSQVNVARAGAGLRTVAAGRATESSTARVGIGEAQIVVNSNSGIAARNGTGSHTIPFGFTSTTGNELVFVIYGSVTHSNATWDERLSPVNSGELSVFTKTSAGESSITVTHNASDYPTPWRVYELPAGTTYTAGTGENTTSDTWPTLSGLPGTSQLVIAARGRSSASPLNDAPSTAWDAPWVEDADLFAADDGSTDGGYLTVGHRQGVTGTSVTPSATTTYSWSTVDRQHVVFALAVPAGGSTTTLAAGRAAETSTARAGTGLLTTAAGRAAETSTARAGTGLRTGSAGRPAEPDVARAGAGAKTATAGGATETSTARAGTVPGVDVLPAGQAVDQHDARPGAGAKTAAAGRATEPGVARPGAGLRAVAAGSAAETDTTRPGTGARAGTAGRATEPGVARAGAGLRIVISGRAASVDTARAAAGVRSSTAGRATETTTGRAGAGLLTAAAGRAVEVDVARTPLYLRPVRSARAGVRVGSTTGGVRFL